MRAKVNVYFTLHPCILTWSCKTSFCFTAFVSSSLIYTKLRALVADKAVISPFSNSSCLCHSATASSWCCSASTILSFCLFNPRARASASYKSRQNISQVKIFSSKYLILRMSFYISLKINSQDRFLDKNSQLCI